MTPRKLANFTRTFERGKILLSLIDIEYNSNSVHITTNFFSNRKVIRENFLQINFIRTSYILRKK